MHRDEADFAQRYRHSFATNRENSGADSEAIDQQMGRRLGGGYNVCGRCRDANLYKMIGDGDRWTSRIVRDEGDLGVAVTQFSNASRGTGNSDRA
jgi:hypothetical protein